MRLIDADKLPKMYAGFCDANGNEYGAGKFVLLDDIEKAPTINPESLRAKGEWIPASEPPKDHKEYIVMIKGATCPTTLWYRPSQNTWNAVGDKAYEVTHWMPLPPAPKGE